MPSKLAHIFGQTLAKFCQDFGKVLSRLCPKIVTSIILNPSKLIFPKKGHLQKISSVAAMHCPKSDTKSKVRI